MKLLIIFAISAVLLQYHCLKQTVLPKELSNYQLQNIRFDDGGVSDVELAINEDNGVLVVIKITSKIQAKGDHPQHAINEIIEFAQKEANILENLPPHPNIVKFENFYETTENVYLVMKYASGGNVYQYLMKNGKMNENNARDIFKQVFKAVVHCHNHGIAHRDLKTMNLLIDSDNNIKLADFGFATKFSPFKLIEDYFGTSNYQAPEIWFRVPHDGFKSDIWTLGAILYELVCGPIPHGSQALAYRVYLARFHGNVESGDELSDDYKDLIHRTLAFHPDDRLSLTQIKEHAWMKMVG